MLEISEIMQHFLEPVSTFFINYTSCFTSGHSCTICIEWGFELQCNVELHLALGLGPLLPILLWCVVKR